MRAILPLLLAGSFSIPAPAVAPSDPRFESTVALAGDQVVWVEARGSASALVAPGRELLVLPPTGAGANRHDLAAGPGIALVQRLACTNSACTRNRGRDALRVDLQTGAASAVRPVRRVLRIRARSSTSASSCGAPCSPSAARVPTGVRSGGRDVTNESGGHQSPRPGASPSSRRLGPAPGRLADRRGDPPRARRLPRSALRTTSGWARTARSRGSAKGVQVLRPGDRRAAGRRPANDFITQPRIAGGRLAVRRIELDGTSRIRVSALDGTGARTVNGQSGRSATREKSSAGRSTARGWRGSRSRARYRRSRCGT